MFRKLLLALAILLLPIAGAHALGLGGITLHSRLNEPLNAEVELLSVEPGDLEKLRVNLGSRDEFEQAGLDRPFVLASLNFATVKHGDKTFIKVTTKEAFREPFVSFLLKVEWPNGRLLREYTLLLDPPVVTREAAPAVQAPAATAAPQMAPAQSAPAAGSGRSTPMPRAVPAPRTAPMAADEYRVRRGDSLLQITRDTFSDPSVSSQQAMLAYLRANPEAFINNNINLLKEGYVLRVPSAQEALSVDQAEAVAEVRRQVAEWRTYRQQRMAAAGGGAAMASAPQPRLEVVAPKGEAGAGGEGAGGQAAAGSDAAGLQHELSLAKESAEARRLENEELRNQVADLEKKLADMQRLVTVKVDELAALQAQLKQAEKGGEAGTPATSETVPATETAPASAAAQTEPAPATEQPAAMPETTTPATSETTTPAAPETTAEAPQPQATTPPPTPAVQPPKPEPVSPPTSKGFGDYLLSILMEDPVVLGGVGGGVLLLILLLIVMGRRRKTVATEASEFDADLMIEEPGEERRRDDQEILDVAAEMDVADFDEPEEPQGAEEEKGGVDQVIAEADVYLAYGRYQQAEELIKGTLEEHPDRLDLKSKLLEVYFATRDREAFEAVVQEVHSELQAAGGAEWDKLQLMGQDLCPGNPLFGGESGMMPDAESTLPPGALDTGIDFDPFSEAAATEGEPKAADEDQGLEFDLGELEGAESEPEAAAPVGEADQGLDFDFDLGEEQEPAQATTQEEEIQLPEVEGEPSQALEFDSTLLGTEQEDEELDLSFDLEGAAEGDDSGLDLDIGGSDAEAEADLSSTDFDLELNTIQTDTEKLQQEAESEAESEADESAEEQATPVAPADASMAEDRDFSIEWDITGMGLEVPDVPDEEEESEADISGAHVAEPVEDLESTAVLDFTAVPLDDEGGGDADMVATKLDLAKAYIDMGDADGARNILDEVAKEGNDAQRKEAADLLAGL